jgi:hypothetical protein
MAMFADRQLERVQVAAVQALADLDGVDCPGAARLRRSIETIVKRLDREANAFSAVLNRRVEG